MKNITLAIDEDVLERARLVAAEQKKTTVNAMVREFLADVAGRDERLEKAREGLRELMRNSKGRMRADFKFDREETQSARVFLDTNVLIYAAAGDEVDPDKFTKAGEILTTETFAISTQVIGEFIRNVQNPRKMTSSAHRRRGRRLARTAVRLPGDLDRSGEILLNAAFFQAAI